MKVAIAAFLTLLCLTQALGQKCSVDSGFRGSSYSINRYKNRELIKTIRNLDEIPLPVRNRLNEHLKSKLGEEFFRKLKLEWGEWIDLERLKRESPKDYEWNAPMGAFDLVFWFSDSTKGLKSFYSTIVLNNDGSIRKDILLPNIRANPEKSKIISCEDAISIAAGLGFPRHALDVSFEYSEKQDSFIWVITDTSGTTPDEPLIIGQGTYKKIEIHANTGSVIRVYKETIVV